MSTIFKKTAIIFTLFAIIFSNIPTVMASENEPANFSEQIMDFLPEAASSPSVYNKGGWKVRYDSPKSGKPYPHLHFYKGKKHIYCLRLDNFKPCDSTAKNKNKIPKSVMKSVMKNSKVKSAVKKYNARVYSKSVLRRVKPLIVAGAAVGVVVATANIFAGPIDDVAAWAALSAALGL